MKNKKKTNVNLIGLVLSFDNKFAISFKFTGNKSILILIMILYF